MQPVQLNVKLIPQDKSRACWYACAQMLLNWRWEQRGKPPAHDPTKTIQARTRHLFNRGLPPKQTIEFVSDMGFRAVPQMPPLPAPLAEALRKYGPIMMIANEIDHARVITGVSVTHVSLNDPAPVNVGSRKQITYEQFGLENVSATDKDLARTEPWKWPAVIRGEPIQVPPTLMYCP